MKRSKSRKKRTTELPKELAPLFWDCDFETLVWGKHRDFIIGRVLAHGGWDAIQTVRLRVSDPSLSKWFSRTQGRDLTVQQMCFWQVVLNLPQRAVKAWLRAESRQIWDRRNSA
jgi:hypothetical protein